MIYKISIPTDNGFWGRECRVCNKYFKIDANKIKTDMFCPYCGELQQNDNLWTKEQTESVNEIAAQVGLRYVEDELEKMLQNIARGSKFITYKPGVKTQVHTPIKHLERDVDTEIECPQCTMTFQVYGIFGFCPGCGEDNILIYEANLNLLIHEIETSADLNRSLRHAYNDFVCSFESYCKKVAEANNLGFANFQNLKNTKELFKRHETNIYAGISDKEKTTIKRVFEKRHAYQHSQGKITQAFIKEIPEDYLLINTIANLSKDEFLEAVIVLKKILKNITGKYSR
jgi:rRNA maturation endonuclease Nob1